MYTSSPHHPTLRPFNPPPGCTTHETPLFVHAEGFGLSQTFTKCGPRPSLPNSAFLAFSPARFPRLRRIFAVDASGIYSSLSLVRNLFWVLHIMTI